jgi:hypothetical protein
MMVGHLQHCAILTPPRVNCQRADE